MSWARWSSFGATRLGSARWRAFDFSEHADDWRDLMRLYLVRRTRSFIQDNYAETDQETGRKFLTYEDGTRSFFPTRVPRTVKFAIDDSNPDDQYAKLYSPKVVDIVKDLHLPRYGLGNYVLDNPETPPTKKEEGRSTTFPGLGNGSSDSAAPTCSNAWRAVARPSCNP